MIGMAPNKSPGTLLTGVVLACTVVAGVAFGQEAGQGKALRVAPAACERAMYRVLPGEFNLCVARKLWDKGDRKQAIELLELASGWGNKSAQFALGVAYFNGDGVAQDRARGLAWLALAAERQTSTARGFYLSALARANAADRARAEELHGQMRAKYADEVAAVRADRYFRRAMRRLASNPVYGGGTCVDGVNANQFARPADKGAMVRACSMASEQTMREDLQRRYDHYFTGWKGRVTVGPIEPLNVPRKP